MDPQKLRNKDHFHKSKNISVERVRKNVIWVLVLINDRFSGRRSPADYLSVLTSLGYYYIPNRCILP